MNKSGQVTIFIIIAVLVIAMVALFFVFKDDLIGERVSSEVAPVYNSFTECVEENMLAGISILESSGGYIYAPDFEDGSEYMPFSSQMDFLGTNIPYWYYISGNNFEREQVPSKSEIEEQLEEFLDSQISYCDLSSYFDEFDISKGNPKAKINIKDNEVNLNLKMQLSIAKGEETSIINSHEISVDSDLGLLYENAVKVYEKEEDTYFLENYTLGIINSYAPVDGVEFSCSSVVWDIYEVFANLQEAINQNFAALKVHGSSDDFFVIDVLSNSVSKNVDVNFMTSSNWPVTFEVAPSEGPLLVANPVGNEAGLGALGFCYVAYHFVYDYKYPVLIQLRSEDTGEIFQFPFAVVIEGTNPRKSLADESAYFSEEEPEICDNANTEFTVAVVDSYGELIDAEISFECFTSTCDIGIAENGILKEMFPQCVNGFVIAQAEGYENAEVQTTTVNPGSLTIFMQKLYEMEVYLEMDSSYYKGNALITFEDESGNLQTIAYPEQKIIEISDGTYEISVSAYENVSLELGSSTQEYCVDVPRKILGVLGLTKEECYEIEIPEQLISQALSGGGKAEYTFTESNLRNSERIRINAEEFPEPNSLIQIQENYVLFENKNLEVGMI